jgi:hypothetical protein
MSRCVPRLLPKSEKSSRRLWRRHLWHVLWRILGSKDTTPHNITVAVTVAVPSWRDEHSPARTEAFPCSKETAVYSVSLVRSISRYARVRRSSEAQVFGHRQIRSKVCLFCDSAGLFTS